MQNKTITTGLGKVKITYIKDADFPLDIDGVHLYDSDIKELYLLLKEIAESESDTPLWRDQFPKSITFNKEAQANIPQSIKDKMMEDRAKAQVFTRNFHCQRNEEMESKCEDQCDHCRKYYAPIDDFTLCECNDPEIFTDEHGINFCKECKQETHTIRPKKK